MIPVILSGGSGTRLWPVSREAYPKQFCEFFDQSFLLNTYRRVRPFGKPSIVTLQTMAGMTLKSLRDTDFVSADLILEPLAKNTATAIALFCLKLIREGKGEEVMAVFPADHLITETGAFEQSIHLAAQLAATGAVVTVGIPPRSAATGYGYIEVAREPGDVSGQLEAVDVVGFHEKPDSKKAEKFIRSGKHYWNSGIFIFKANRIAQIFSELMPDLWDKMQSVASDWSNLKHVYANVIGTSIDYGVMEKLRGIQCIPCDLGWSDVGSWDEIARLNEEAEGLEISSEAQVFSVGGEDNFVYSKGKKVIGLCDVSRLIVVDTPDALLVVPRGKSQRVRDLVAGLRKEALPEVEGHLSEERPWGRFDVLADAPDHKVKRLVVDVGQQLSYQVHQRRDEYWLVVRGQAEIECEEGVHLLRPGNAFGVQRGKKHRIRNGGQETLIIIEVQLGEYFGEDDIIRFKDDYRRD